MKNDKPEYRGLFISILIIFCFYTIGFCFDDTLYTPKGSWVGVFDHSSWVMTDTEYAMQMQYANTYVNQCGAQILALPTYLYNCHDFAWDKSEGGVAYQMNAPEHQKYYHPNTGDGSYLQEDNAARGEKISYIYDDHTAIETTIDDVFISKWGAGCLMLHTRTCCPYDINDWRIWYFSRYIREISNKFYISGDDIEVASHSTLTAGNNIIINSGAKVRYVSHGAMNIQSGFSVQNGAQFTAETW